MSTRKTEARRQARRGGARPAEGDGVERLTLTRARLLRLAAGLAVMGVGPRLPAFAAAPVRGAVEASTLTMPERGWLPTPMVTAALRADADVRFGGEGGQYPRHVAIDGERGLFLLVGIDVGGILRSRDGGDTWEPANVGYSPRGAIHVAIDPRNAQRAIAVGCNMSPKPWHGLYLTTDQAASWTHVQPATYSGVRDWREQLAYDRSSYQPSLGYCTDVYWSRVKRDTAASWSRQPQPPEETAIYRSSDGGATWDIINRDITFGGGAIAVHPEKRGKLYVTTVDAGADDGIYGSEDGGRTFTKLRAGAHRRSLTTSPAAPEAVWALTAENALVRSDDEGRTWRRLPLDGIDHSGERLIRVAVSAADAAFIAVTAQAGTWQYALYVSQDGGRRWTKTRFDHSRAFLPAGSRHHNVAWSPAAASAAWTYTQASNYIGRSTDGGRSFTWASDGISMVAGMGTFHLSPIEPDHVFIPARDQNGGVSFDGGRTWRYTNVSNVPWGGHNAAGVVAAPDAILAANRPDKLHGLSQLRIFRGGAVEDGGAWRIATMGPDDPREVRWTHRPDRARFGMSSCFVDPAAPDVWFAGPYRSEDAGRRWSPMRGCHGILFALPAAPHTLYGVHHRADDVLGGPWVVVASADHGRTWTPIVTVDVPVTDVAANRAGDLVYFAAGERDLFRFDVRTGFTRQLTTPSSQFERRHYNSLALDPGDEERIYACGNADEYINMSSAIMSRDGGESWVSLNVRSPLRDGRRGGGSEAKWVRVHPRTREAWFTTSCFGTWRYRPADI